MNSIEEKIEEKDKGNMGKSEKQIEITRAVTDDIPKIMNLMERSLSLAPDQSWYAADSEEFVREHVSERGFILKAVAGEEIAGFLLVRYPGKDSDNLGSYTGLDETGKQLVAHMESAAVDPAFRGMGIQKKLMAQGEECIKNTKYKYLMGTAHPENKFSVNNFLKLGYEIIAEDKKYGGYPRYVFLKKR